MPGWARPLAERFRAAAFVMVLAMVGIAACAAPGASPTVVRDPPLAGPEALPEADEFVPAGVDGATDWTPMSSLPHEFDISARFASPAELANEFRSQLEAGWAGGPKRPTFELDTYTEGDAGTVVVISETGVEDDSVAGTQYALVIGRGADGWTLNGLWGRALCQRGVDLDSQLCV